MVFPLGMYSVATYRMRIAIDLQALGWLPTVVFVVALTAWAATFAGMAHHLARSALAVRSSESLA